MFIAGLVAGVFLGFVVIIVGLVIFFNSWHFS